MLNISTNINFFLSRVVRNLPANLFLLVKRVLLVVLLLFFVFAVCEAQKPTKRKNHVLQADEQRQLTETFYNAEKEKIISNYPKAESLFLKCLHLDPMNDVSMYELANIYYQQSRYNEAVQMLKKAISINNSNKWYKVLLAEIFLKNRQYSEGVKIYEDLIKQEPTNINYKTNLANALILSKKYTEAVKIYDEIEKNIGITEEIIIQKVKIYKGLRKYDKAIEEIKKLIELYPEETNYYGMLAEIYLANNQKDSAFATYQKILQIDPANALVHLSLADYYNSIQDKENAHKEICRAFENENLDIDKKVRVLLMYNISEENPKTKRRLYDLLEILIKTHPHEAKAYSIYGDFLYRDKNYEKALLQFKKSVELTKNNFIVWHQILMIELLMNDYSAIIKDCDTALEIFPEQPILYLYSGMANCRLKNYDEAITILKKGIDYAISDTSILQDFYNILGDSYYGLKDYKNSFSAYEKVLELNPQNSLVLNNYSYYLSLLGDSLEKAEKMALKANELRPNFPAYQDTYGWVLFKQKRYDEAKIWLEKALNNGGENDGEILEHYGDVLYKLGKKEEALKYWIKAKEQGNTSEILNKKIEDKMLYE